MVCVVRQAADHRRITRQHVATGTVSPDALHWRIRDGAQHHHTYIDADIAAFIAEH